jgi:hypothetical protein
VNWGGPRCISGSGQGLHFTNCCKPLELIALHCPLIVSKGDGGPCTSHNPSARHAAIRRRARSHHSPLIGRTKWRTRHSHAPAIGFVCKCEVLRLEAQLGVTATMHQAAGKTAGILPCLPFLVWAANGGLPPRHSFVHRHGYAAARQLHLLVAVLDAFVIPDCF